MWLPSLGRLSALPEKVTESDKHTSLLRHGINYYHKKFNNTDFLCGSPL
jgi:hypothetical protein